MAATLVACGLGAASAPTAGIASSGFAPIPRGPITFGVSLPLSGATAAYGTLAKLSLAVTMSAFDAQYPHGVDGHQVRLKIVDDAGEVTQAVEVARELVADRVAAVITVTYNPAAAADQYAILNHARIPVVAALPGSQYANTRAWPYDFAINSSYQQLGAAAAAWIAKHRYRRIATIDDGIPEDLDSLHQITSRLQTPAKVVKSVTVAPGTVDMSSAVAQMKATRPDLLLVYLGAGYGPLWSAIRSAGWSPRMLVTAGAWYDGFTAMGPLAARAVTASEACAASPTQRLTDAAQSLADRYATATGETSVDYLTFIQTDTIPLELLRYAIDRYDSVAPNAIKQAIETMPETTWYGLTYSYSPSNHYGLTGQYGAAVCNMAPPYASGNARVPVKAS